MDGPSGSGFRHALHGDERRARRQRGPLPVEVRAVGEDGRRACNACRNRNRCPVRGASCAAELAAAAGDRESTAASQRSRAPGALTRAAARSQCGAGGRAPPRQLSTCRASRPRPPSDEVRSAILVRSWRGSGTASGAPRHALLRTFVRDEGAPGRPGGPAAPRLRHAQAVARRPVTQQGTAAVRRRPRRVQARTIGRALGVGQRRERKDGGDAAGCATGRAGPADRLDGSYGRLAVASRSDPIGR